MDYMFSDLISANKIQELIDSFYAATNIPSSVVLNNGDIIAHTGWRDICVEFHRKNPEAEKSCIQSAKGIGDRLKDDSEYTVYKCPNGLVDAAAPIIVAGEHVANVMTGQFLYNEPSEEDLSYFKRQAHRFGFDEARYLKALYEVPVISDEKVERILKFLTRFAGLLAEMGLIQMKQIEASRALQRVNDELESIVADRTKALTRLSDDLKQEVEKHKQTEEALRESERKYRHIVESLPLGVHMYKYTSNGRLIFTGANPAADAILGVDNSQYVDKSIEEAFPSSENTELPDRYKQLCTEGGSWHSEQVDYEDELVRGAFEVHAFQTAPGHMATMFSDITSRKQTEEALRLSEERYRNLYNTAQVGMLRTAISDGKIFQANQNAADIFGYDDLMEFMSTFKFSEQYVDPGVRDEVLAVVQKNGEITNYEARFRRKDGSIIWGRFSARLDSNKKYLEGVCIDITEEKQALKALQRSQERYRVLFENANDAIFIAQDEVVKFPNPKTLEMTGYSEDELSKTPFTNIIHPKDRGMVLERYQKRINGKRPPATYSFRILTKRETELWVQLNTVFITWEGRPATLNFLRDITEQKELEDQFQQAQKMEAIGTLAGGIAHDFNNLLMGVQGRTSLMLLNKDLSTPHREHLKGIEGYIKSATDLTRQLLGFARGGKYEVVPTNLNELVKNSSEMFGRTQKDITIYPKYQTDIWTVEVDQGQIEQVLLNLYVNAWQAMSEGGKLYLETENITMDEYLAKAYGVEPGKYVKIAVTDTGSGMDKKTQQRIFDPFFTTKEMGRGTGLGLASAYGILKNHHGIINVYSEPGQGTTFNIYLPVSEKKLRKEKDTAAGIVGGSEGILLVDDEELVIAVGSQMLEKLGYQVECASSGEEAIKLYREKQDAIQLIILDMVLPGMGGGQIYDKLKEVNPAVKVLLSSGYTMDGTASDILNRGCNGFIQKPFNLKQLSLKVRNIIDEVPESG